MQKCTYLASQQQQDLWVILGKFPTLFKGIHKTYNGDLVHLRLKPNATPSFSHPYLLPQVQLQVIKKEH